MTNLSCLLMAINTGATTSQTQFYDYSTNFMDVILWPH